MKVVRCNELDKRLLRIKITLALINQSTSQLKHLNFLLALLLYLSLIGLGYFVDQSDFWTMLPFYLVAFTSYVILLIRPLPPRQLGFWIGFAILLRFAQLFHLPNLSDDLYRFIWDGRLWLNGINPFEQLPSYYMTEQITLQGINEGLYNQLNSPEYYTIYPPIAQLNFVVACWLFPNSIWGSAFVMKLLLFAFECGSIFLILKLLRHWKMPERRILIYGLNPLIVLEITGNLHFEGAMIFFLLLAIWWLAQQKWQLSAVVMSLSIASKLLPLMFLPLLIKRLGWKKSIFYFLVVGGISILLFAPLLSSVFIQNFGDSLDLYFRKFEFNASTYYFGRWLGFQLKGYNVIGSLGPALASMTLISILAMAALEKKPSITQLPVVMLWAISIHLTFTTTVHPWYTALPLVLCSFTNYRFPVVWSGMIFLTYINYSYEVYQENLWIVGLEYLVVWGFLIWEYSWHGKHATKLSQMESTKSSH